MDRIIKFVFDPYYIVGKGEQNYRAVYLLLFPITTVLFHSGESKRLLKLILCIRVLFRSLVSRGFFNAPNRNSPMHHIDHVPLNSFKRHK